MSFPLSLSERVSRYVRHENDDARASFCHRVKIGSVDMSRRDGGDDWELRCGLIFEENEPSHVDNELNARL